MPKMTSKSTLLRLPQIEMLTPLAGGAKLTTQKLQRKTGLSGDPQSMGLLDLGLVEREILWVDGAQEHVWRITDKGKQRLKEAGISAPIIGTPVQTTNHKMKVTTLVPWAGGARMTAETVGKELEGIPFVGIPFAGGMPELVHIRASTILVNDLHRHVINLAVTLQDDKEGPRMIRQLKRIPFHPESLRLSQTLPEGSSNYTKALNYFISQWMSRNGRSGGPNELKGALALRYSATGGDSALRYSQAVQGLKEWRKILQRCTFSCGEWRPFIAKIKDGKAIAIYADPPWPELGDALYTHKFTEKDHRDLSRTLHTYTQARVVVRYLDCQLARELYPEPEWTWRRFAGRNTGNKEVKEVLIIKNPK